MEVDLKPPLPHKIRLYIYNATQPPGGRTLGEHKIQLIVPGQEKGDKGCFDHSGGRIVILAGYRADIDVFILWDSGCYPEFSHSRNVQVKPETVYEALSGIIGVQKRNIRRMGIEKVITCNSKQLSEALQLRLKYTQERLLGGK